MQINKFQSDFKAGIVVFLVTLPLCLGISLACGVPLLSGLISGIIGGLVVTIISTSKYSVSGPAASLTAIVISSISELKTLDLFFLAVLLSGLIQLIFGIIRIGNISSFIPNAVVKGTLAGIGIILILKQLPHMVGYDADPEGDLSFNQIDGQNSFTELWNMFDNIAPGAIVVSILSFLVIFVSEYTFFKSRRIFSLIPGPLLAVCIGILYNIIFQNSSFWHIGAEHMVNLPPLNSLEAIASHLRLPHLADLNNPVLWRIALTIAIVATIETLLSIEAIEKIDPDRVQLNANKELIAQGTGNMFSGLIGGLPVTSVIVRSSANINAGARTKLSIIISALLLLLTTFLFPGILNMIPNATLAVILAYTGYKLARIELFKEQYHAGWDYFIPFLVTILVMLRTDMLIGVGAGVLVSIWFIIRFSLKKTFETAEDIIEGRKTYLIKLPQHATFFSKGFITDYLSNIEDNSTVIIDGSINKNTDKDVKEVFIDFNRNALQRNIHIQLVKFNF